MSNHDAILLELGLPQGVDLAWHPGKRDLIEAGGQLQVITGLDVFMARIHRVMTTPKGALWDLPEYGFDATHIIGRAISDEEKRRRTVIETMRALSWEARRIRDVQRIEPLVERDRILVDLRLVAVGFERPVDIQHLPVWTGP